MAKATNSSRFALAVALLSLLECSAKKSSPSASLARPSSSTANRRPRRAAAQAPGRRVYTTRQDEDEVEDEHEEEDDLFGSAGGNESGWDSLGDDVMSDDDDLSDDDWPVSSSSSRRQGKQSRRRLDRVPDPDSEFYELDDLESDEDWDSLSRELSWSDGEEHYDEAVDSWDEPASMGGGRRGVGNDGRRYARPSAWTGDGPSDRGRRQSGRRERRRRLAARGSAVRYQRGRRRSASGGFSVRIPAVSGAAIASALRRQMGTAREAVGQASSIAASTSKRLKREVKLAVSGSWESALLKVTWPDDLPPDEALVDSLVAAVKTFKLERDVTKNSAEHRVLLRKLWTKMSEPDWRTISKAVCLFHTILQDVSPEQHAVLKLFLGKMSRESDKRTGGHYFDLDVLCDVNEDGEAFRSFVDRYGTFVFKRAEGFSAGFQELDTMRREEGWESVVVMLAKAQKALDLALSCLPTPEEETELTVLCLANTAHDVGRLWCKFHSALEWTIDQAEDGDLFGGVDQAVVADCLNGFRDFCSSRHGEAVSFLADAEELLGIYGLDGPDVILPSPDGFCEDSEAVLSSDTATMSSDGDASNDDDDDEPDHGSFELRRRGCDAGADEQQPSAPFRKEASASSSGASGSSPASRRSATLAVSKATPRGALGTSGGSDGGDGGDGGDSSSTTTITATSSSGNSDVTPSPAAAATTSRPPGETARPLAPLRWRSPGKSVSEAGKGTSVDERKAPREIAVGDLEAKNGERAGQGGGEAGAGDGESATAGRVGGHGEEDDGEDTDDDIEDEDDDLEDGENDEEDSAEEGAVDDHVDDLTFFDDATQPEASDGDTWDRY